LAKQPTKSVEVVGIADTGAQSNLWSLDQFLAAGFRKADLSPATLSLNAANKSPIRIDGAFFANMVGTSKTDKDVSCRSMIYVSRDVKTLYLSYDTMLDLAIINPGFPTIGEYGTTGGLTQSWQNSNEKNVLSSVFSNVRRRIGNIVSFHLCTEF